jgi:hypothetical protein
VTDPRRDRWGRYLLPDPETGEERAWTRATTFAETLADQYGLTAWKMRNVAKGIAQRDDLRALAAATPITQKKQLDRVAQQAVDAVAAKAGANIGTALHEWTAQFDRLEGPNPPQPWHADLSAYALGLSEHGIITHPGLVERIVCLPDLGVAGTFDRIVEWYGQMYIADVKTAADLSYSWGSIAVQLALYSRASWAWNEEQQEWGKVLAPERDKGLVIHLPAGQAKCELYWVDLEAGWEAATLAADVRAWRKRTDLAWPIGVDMIGRSPVQPVLDLAGGDGAEVRASGPAPDRAVTQRDDHASAPPAKTSPTHPLSGNSPADDHGDGDGSRRSPYQPVTGSTVPAGDQR